MTKRIAAASPEAVQAWARLLRVGRQLTESVEADLKAAALPELAWYDALHEVAEAGEAGLRPYQLIERMLLAQYNVSRLLARLEGEGLIERLAVADDGRGQAVRITETGRQMRRRMWAVYGPAIGRLLGAKLPAAELRRLASLLGELREPPVA